MKEFIKKLANRENLNPREMREAMLSIMEGKATPGQIGAFLVALKMKGESIEEITEAAKVMREKSLRVEVDREEGLLDTCGTGGDGKHTFNVSTVSAFVVAGTGIKIAKHGNRGVSSGCGSADVLNELGVKLELTPSQVAGCIQEIGIGFLFAPSFHPAMKYATPVRRELGMRSIFNILGPLSNPALANIQIVGVYSAHLIRPLIEVLKNLGHIAAMVVHGKDGYDEITLTGPTLVAEYREGKIREYTLTPEELGFKKCSPADIEAGDKTENARILKGILAGEIKDARRDMVLVNAGAAIYLAGKAKDLKEGINIAHQAILSGKGKEKLEALVEYTRSLP
ncbi:MAG: anthranilate phosphoribosyltransferase [Caldiserica bacterium]|nr:anthranilate phosphoribosyltransferase [Caldisericota bacterium]